MPEISMPALSDEAGMDLSCETAAHTRPCGPSRARARSAHDEASDGLAHFEAQHPILQLGFRETRAQQRLAHVLPRVTEAPVRTQLHAADRICFLLGRERLDREQERSAGSERVVRGRAQAIE